MQEITPYIIEKLQINKTTKIPYKYFPKTRKELEDILNNEFNYEHKKKLNLNSIDISKIDDISGLFTNLSKIEELDISKWNTSHVIDMQYLFNQCKNLKVLHIENWDVRNVENMNHMFDNCIKLDTDLSLWKPNSLKEMNAIFFGCNKFTGKGLENWNVENVVEAKGAFAGCINIRFDINKWNLKNLLRYNLMFQNCALVKPAWYINKTK